MPDIINVTTSPAEVITISVPGVQGPASNLSIGTVTTGAVGSSASATITGVAPNQLLNLTIPASSGSSLVIGTTAGTAAAGNDPRLSDARTPLAHTHPIADLTATGTKDATTYLRGDGTWSVPSTGSVTAANITDATATGRSVLTAATAAAARTAIGAGTSSLIIGTTASDAKAGNYQPTAANISDATTIGRTVLTALDAAAVRTAIGAGTSSLVIGTTNTTAKAGDYAPPSDAAAATASMRTLGTGATQAAAGNHTHTPASIGAAAATHTHAIADLTATGTKDATTFLRGDGTWAVPPGGGAGGTVTVANITDATAIGRTVLTSVDAAAVRTNIGAGTSSLVIGTTGTTAAAGNHTHLAANITDTTTVGRAVMVAVDAAAARTAIGAGTSSLAIGTTNTTAKAGDYAPPAATTAVAGLVQLTNHLAGTSTAPTVRAGSETQTGILELATAAETTTGTSNALAVHPQGLKVELDKKANLVAVEGVVTHDGTAGGGVRPSGFFRVRWVGGTVRPTNMLTNDIWEHTA